MQQLLPSHFLLEDERWAGWSLLGCLYSCQTLDGALIQLQRRDQQSLKGRAMGSTEDRAKTDPGILTGLSQGSPCPLP